MAQRIGPYKILRRLGQGGMAEVLLAEEEGISGATRLVCLKQILPHLRAQETFLKMFLDEARIVMRLTHPHIAQVFQVVEVDNQILLVMEYIHGEDLRSIYNQEVLQGQTVSPQVAARIMHDVALALDYAHRQVDRDLRPLHLVHRDISPQNILVTYEGYAKIIDFGVAKAASNLNKTRTGVLKGKYSYMSPEQAHGETIDQRSDLFSLGITIYEITCGKRLFKRESDIETLQAVAKAEVPKPSSLVKGFPKELEAILLKALAKAPENRFSTASKLAEACNNYLRRHHQGYPQSELGSYMQTLFAEKLANHPSIISIGKKLTQSKSGPISINSDEVILANEATVLSELTQSHARQREKTQALASWLPASQDQSKSNPTDEQTNFLQLEPAVALPDNKAAGAQEQMEQPEPLATTSPALADIATNQLAPPPSRNKLAGSASRIIGGLLLLIVILVGVLWAKTRPSDGPIAQTPPAPDTPEIVHQPMVEGGMEKSLLLLTGPKFVSVLLDGSELGQLPLTEIPLQPGQYNITLHYPSMAFVRQEKLMVGPQERITWNMLASQRLISFLVDPWAFVQIGQQVPFETMGPGEQPAQQSLMIGSYTLLLECPDGQRYERLLHVTNYSEPSFRFHCPQGNTAAP